MPDEIRGTKQNPRVYINVPGHGRVDVTDENIIIDDGDPRGMTSGSIGSLVRQFLDFLGRFHRPT